MASEEVGGSFCRDDSCVITDQLATGSGVLERELLENAMEKQPACAAAISSSGLVPWPFSNREGKE